MAFKADEAGQAGLGKSEDCLMPDLDGEHEAFLLMPPDFPYLKLLEIAKILEDAKLFVHGYIPPFEGPYHPDGFMRECWLDGVKTILLPDRNVASRFAQVAQGEPLNDDHQRRHAAAILAFSQCLDILIEPSIAFHELAQIQGNEIAHEELAWFRIADDGKVHDWVAAALGEVNCIQSTKALPSIKPLDLAKPPKRWRRNYIVAMKIGELELSDQNAMEKTLSLLQWMYQDFILAGPATMLACIYFAPNSPRRKRLLKCIRASDREKAIEGVKNAAWDITYVSDFVHRINENQEDRFILATFDVGLRDMARLALDGNNSTSLALSLQQWWPLKDAQRISEIIFDYMEKTRSQHWWGKYDTRPDYVRELTERGEAVLRNWAERA